jgi:hypothetical protein
MKKELRARRFTTNSLCAVEDSNFPYPLIAIQNGCVATVSKRVAQEWVMFQQTVPYQGGTYWLQICAIGLGLYEVKRRARENKKTVLVQKFEEI